LAIKIDWVDISEFIANEDEIFIVMGQSFEFFVESRGGKWCKAGVGIPTSQFLRTVNWNCFLVCKYNSLLLSLPQSNKFFGLDRKNLNLFCNSLIDGNSRWRQ
jgi:hypothetical protein